MMTRDTAVQRLVVYESDQSSPPAMRSGRRVAMLI
jgi:hypothetical protein